MITRQKYPIPDFVRQTLEKEVLWTKYQERPEYQRNDYVGWIARAKREETKQKRLDQMIEELRGGDRYMKMKWKVRKLKYE
ncbi:MAG: YdeI/OmpD-associated family protein [Candidatus Shapirobacteria bacterium]|jgi:uncharacterized protein YdeI (YjbR/CyaY-like superfamily)